MCKCYTVTIRERGDGTPVRTVVIAYNAAAARRMAEDHYRTINQLPRSFHLFASAREVV